MSEFEFFKRRADRWGESMRAPWGSLEICPPTDHIDLPHHTAGELLSIGHLKAWGDAQKLHLSMAYFLVQADNSSEAGNYSLAMVWIDSCQARMVSMGEALEALSSHTPKGLTGHTFSFSRTKVPTICLSLKMGTFVSYPKEKWGTQVGR